MKKSIIIALALAIVLINGCTKLKDFNDINLNPAATTAPITSALLTSVIANTGATWAQQALYCQYFSETQYPDFSCYSLNQATPQAIYSDRLYDLQNIIIYNTDADKKDAAALNGANDNQIAIAKILQTYIYWTITDRWGDVPYSDALTGNPNVTYDTQESIYKGMISTLTAAIAQFTTTGAPVKGDIAYNGDITMWKRLANSMRMLMALRLSKQYPGAGEYAATEFNNALNDAAGSIDDNAYNFTLNYPGGNFKNPFYNMYDGRKDYGESATLTSLMVDSLGGDARSAVFGGDVNGGASTLGVPYGRNRTFVTDWTNTHTLYAWVFNPTYRQPASPLYVVKASSVLLARAEAAQLGWTSETVATLYQAGITASFTQWGLAAPSAGYLAGTAVALAGNATDIKKINTQQYLSYFPDGLQGWSNWRRTNYPVLVPAPDGTNIPLVIPRRWVYGTADYSLTPDGVAAAVARLKLAGGDDTMDSRVWWDK